jgi:hypothetical protein
MEWQEANGGINRVASHCVGLSSDAFERFRFLYDGRRIMSDQTVASLEMEEYVIFVFYSYFL